NQLLRPFSQMNGLSQSWTPDGRVKTHSLEATFQRRFSSGFTFNGGYTALWERDRDFYYNEFDVLPSWRQTNAGVPHRFSATGIYELPFGKGRMLFHGGIMNVLMGGWQVAATYEIQPGPLLDWGNVFYTGDPSNVNNVGRTLDRWFNTDGFERNNARVPAAFQTRVFPQRVDGLRGDGLNRMDANVQRDIKLHERLTLQLRLDALNVANRSQFENPNLDPVSTNFGRVTNNTSSTMRFLLIQARLRF
ncbi:MAG: hypothetical protein SGI92_15570, partial [Bryobacteraceae bacterium]|nr:hypothetical protein [Bryobacteraceae bacterium]